MATFDPKRMLCEVRKRRGKEAFAIIGAVTGIAAKRLQEIADGKGEPPTPIETMMLDLADGVSR